MYAGPRTSAAAKALSALCTTWDSAEKGDPSQPASARRPSCTSRHSGTQNTPPPSARARAPTQPNRWPKAYSGLEESPDSWCILFTPGMKEPSLTTLQPSDGSSARPLTLTRSAVAPTTLPQRSQRSRTSAALDLNTCSSDS